MKFIEVITRDRVKIYLNVAHISEVMSAPSRVTIHLNQSKSYSLVTMLNKDEYVVEDTPEQILERCKLC